MGRFNGYNTISLHFVFLICLLFISFPLGISELRAFDCKNDAGYVHGSRYESNLNSVMYDLANNTANTGFKTFSHGLDAEDVVYGLGQCRENASPQECTSCAQEASITLQQLCENDIGGLVWFDVCFLRYDGFSFFSVLDAHVVSIFGNPRTVKDNPAGFQNDVKGLLDSLTDENSDSDLEGKGFAAGFAKSSFSDTHRVFGLAECRRDLPIKDCKSCLLIALKKLYPFMVKKGGEALLGSCRIRFETYPFSTVYTSNATAHQIYLSSTLAHHTSNATAHQIYLSSTLAHQRKSPRNAAILCGSIGGGLLVSVICIHMLVKKINKMRSMTMESPVLIKQMEKGICF